MRKPNFFIVGAARSGTTAMYQYLKAHPDVFMPIYKEPHYFGADLRGPRMEQFRGKPDKYLALFKEAGDKKRVGEGSIWYLISELAAEEIKTFNPEAKILIMLRRPTEMMYSYYHQAIYTGNEDLATFEEALDAEADRKQGRRLPRMAHTVNSLWYTNLVRYADHVTRYFDTFGRENVHVIIYDDFKDDTAGEYRKTLEFLGIDPTFTTDFSIINPNKEVRLPAIQRALMTVGIHPMLVKDRLTYIAATNTLLPQRVRNRLVQAPIRAYTEYKKRDSMKPETRQMLHELLLPEMERLSELLGRDLTYWCQDKKAVSSLPVAKPL
jgi:hypothetical protein